ncbi:hypothetical protein DJ83_05150 [Halorubrum ezzemoulense]|uniref:DUF7982 domain-containing protein n=1 Tax=Halorubrum ezzemoulense TaxID=337243 RepID=A0A256J1H7_HALEZ|nr:hypothetical protein [Halorubrum ezzemoulense]OYR62523.1 hypothetical protein DJ83_05150 [Halorubrum ezzemoulense]OYR81042.1 hypothetical protein DJ84_14125 [Halorubrum ezzemoulense]
MASTGETDATRSAVTESESPEETSPADLRRQLAVLEAENRQLREEYARAQQATYRRTALGLFIVGVAGIAGGLIFPDARAVLFALGGTGVFAGVLTFVLTPERFVSARVGARLFQALRADRDATVDELGLEGDPVYVPTDDVRLFVPRYQDRPLPPDSALSDLFVVPETPEQGGVAFHPTGRPLFEAFEDTRSQPLGETPHTIAATAADALVELFELADGVEYAVDTDTDRVTFEVVGAGLGDPTGIDHPIPSFLAVSLVETLGIPVRVEITDDDPLAITCRYDTQNET